jgi:DNA-binding CsgD family transcriptional regulator
VPIHYPGGDLGLCASIANCPIDSAFKRDAMQMVSLFTYQRCRQLGGQSETSFAPRLLTPREADCMRWVLKGKSDTDIGGILDISHTTVKFHIERVKKKLDVKTRTQAVATLVFLGYL